MSDERGESSSTSTINFNTEGGTYVEGNLTVGGKFVGRDEVTNVFTEEVAYNVSGLPNPYLGLAAFTYDNRAKYGGRERDIAAAVAKLTDPAAPQSLIFVTGASGSGKSSFAQAGLVPALEAHYAGFDVKRAVFRPSRDPIAGLRDALWRQLGLFQPHASDLTAEAFADFLRQHTPARQINVIVVDQFEELFTQSEPGPRDALIAMLSALPPFEQARTHVVATLRSDYLPELFKLPALFELQKRCSIELRAMTEAELREAIQKPLQATYPDKGKRFDPTLVAQLARDAAEDAAYLPLLQVTLEDIWDRGKLVRGAYTNLGDAIEERANKVLDCADYPDCRQPRSEAEKLAVLGIFLDLVEVSPDDDPKRDVRLRLTRDELEKNAPERRRLIDALANARLLSIARANDDAPVTVDIIHESLLREWDALRNAITDQRRLLQRRARFRQQVNDWVSNNRSPDYLLNGVSLAVARELDKQGDRALQNDDARGLLQQSSERAERAQRAQIRRQRVIIGVVSMLLIAALIASVVAFGQWQEAVAQQKLSRSRELAAIAINQLTVDPERTILIGLEAERVMHTPESQDAIYQGLVQLPVYRLLQGHTKAINSAQFSPDGKRIVTVSSDFTARVWDTATGQEVFQLKAANSGLMCAQFSADGNKIITGGADGTARLWDATTGLEIVQMIGGLGGQGAVTSAQLSPDGRTAVTTSGLTIQMWDATSGKKLVQLNSDFGSRIGAKFSPDGKKIVAGIDRTARVWDAITGKELVQLKGHTEKVNSVDFTPDGGKIVTSGDSTARVWDVNTGIELIQLKGHTISVDSAQFSLDGKKIVTTGFDQTARVWDATTGRELNQLKGHSDFLTNAQFSPDSSQIMTSSSDGTARIWDAVTGSELAQLKGHTYRVYAQFSPDGKRIVTASFDGTARVWDIGSGGQLARLGIKDKDAISNAEFSPDGSKILTVGFGEPVRMWDTNSGIEQGQFKLHALEVNSANGAHFSPDGKSILVVSGALAGILDATTGNELVQFKGHTHLIGAAQFSPDGRKVATAGSAKDTTARIWDTATGNQLVQLDGQIFDGRGAEFSPDGKKVVVVDNEYVDNKYVVRVWDVQNGNQLSQFSGHIGQVFSVKFSPDGANVVTASTDQTARVWDVVSGRELAQLKGHVNSVVNAEYSPDGRRIVTASWDNSARVWDAISGKELVRLNGHIGPVTNARFSPKGDKIVTASGDQTARVWDAATGMEIARPKGHTDSVNGAQFSPDGKRIVTISADGTARIYFTDVADLIELVKSKITRKELACEERRQFLLEDIACPTATPMP